MSSHVSIKEDRLWRNFKKSAKYRNFNFYTYYCYRYFTLSMDSEIGDIISIDIDFSFIYTVVSFLMNIAIAMQLF